MNRVCRVVALALVTLGGAFSVSALEVPLTYETCAEGSAAFCPDSRALVHMTHALPGGSWQLPALTSSEPYYGTFEFAGAKRLAVLDQEKVKGAYDLLYCDLNGNNDLTDDDVIRCVTRPEGDAGERVFPLTLTTQTDGRESQYQASLSVYVPRPGLVLSLIGRLAGVDVTDCFGHLEGSGYYRGSLELEGRRFDLWLADANCNGVFTDRLQLDVMSGPGRRLGGSDWLYVVESGTAPGEWAAQDFADQVVLGGTLYDLVVDVSASKLVLTPVPDAVPVSGAQVFENMALLNLTTQRSVSVYHPADTVMLPAGSYQLVAYQMFRKDEQGDGWRAFGEGSQKVAPFEISANQANAFPFGEPFVCAVDVVGGRLRRGLFGGSTAVLEQVTRGAASERIAEISHVSGTATTIPLDSVNPDRPRRASFKAMKPDGEVVAQGNFEYG